MDAHSDPSTDRRAEVQALAAELYAQRRSYLLAIATRNAANHADAEEAVQFAFLAFLEHFDPEGDAPAVAWLTLTLKRKCWAQRRCEHLDRRSGWEASPNSGEQASSLESVPSRLSDTPERTGRHLEARGALAALNPAERRALSLLAAGYSYAEIGELTGYSYTKTNRLLAEGRAKLRRHTAGV
jgi:RNA polymerase sigma factor (sigma-70 family)